MVISPVPKPSPTVPPVWMVTLPVARAELMLVAKMWLVAPEV